MPLRGSGTASSNPIRQHVGGNAFRLRVEVRDDSVAQHRVRQRANVLEAHVIASARERARLAAEHEVLRSADAGTECDPLLHVVRACLGLGPAGTNDVERVPHHRFRDRHLPHESLEGDQILAAHRTLQLRILQRRRRFHDVVFLVRRVVDDDVEHEAVELRFRQRICPFSSIGFCVAKT